MNSFLFKHFIKMIIASRLMTSHQDKSTNFYTYIGKLKLTECLVTRSWLYRGRESRDPCFLNQDKLVPSFRLRFLKQYFL